MNVNSILWFLLLYFIFTCMQFLIQMISNLADLIVALIAYKVNEITSEINSDNSDEKESTECIGFQIPKIEEEDDN